MPISLESSFTKTFSLFCFLVLLILFTSSYVFIIEDIYYDTFAELTSFERINELIDINNRWSWVAYPLTPLIYLIKFTLVAICISSGAFLQRVQIGLKSIFKVVLLAEYVFLLPALIKLLWFALINTDYTLNDLQYFAPLSALSFFDPAELQPWLIYPLGLFNLFEVAYIITLSYLLAQTIKSDFSESLKLVLCSYGSGLVIWVVFVMFLTVNIGS